MAGKYKIETRTGTVADMVSEAYGELQGLRDEMSEWADNLEGSNLSATEKCGRVRECADNLDQVADDEPEMNAIVGVVEVTVGVQVPRSKRQSASRAVRAGNAEAMLNAVAEAVREYATDLEAPAQGTEGTDEGTQDVIDACETLADHVENTAGELSGLEFPGMFG